MQRVVIYLKRRPDLLRPRLFDWWLGQHRALAEQLPGLRHYIISLAADGQEGPLTGWPNSGSTTWRQPRRPSPAGGQAARADAEAHVVATGTPEPDGAYDH